MVIGPKARAMLAVPRAWTMNRVIRMPMVIGRMKGDIRPATPGASPSPSTADRTDTAGVSTPSA